MQMTSLKTLKLTLVLGCLALTQSLFAQQMNFSQYMLTPMLNNPSLISLSDEIKVDAGYRNQFGGKGSNYSTPFLAAFKPFYQETNKEQFRKFGAGGIQFLNDRTGFSGMLATTGFSFSYAHIANLSRRDWFSFGLQPGFYQRRIDFSKLSSGSQWDGFNGTYDPSLPLNESITGTERVSFFTINAGMTYVRENANGDPFFTFSLGANNLTRPNISLNDKSFANPVNWNIQTSLMAFEDNQFLIKPTIRHIQVRNQSQTNIGSYAYYKLKEKMGFLSKGNIGLGLWYSNQNALITSLEINQKDWALAFSYDFLVSTLAEASNSMGAPEIIVGFRKYLGKSKKRKGDIVPEGGGSGGRKSKDATLDEPQKAQPSQNEIKPEQEIKPGETVKPTEEAPKTDEKPKGDTTKLAPDKGAGTDKPDPGVKPTNTLKDKPAPTKESKTPAKTETKKAPAKKATQSKSSGKTTRKAAKNNIEDPVLAKKMAALRTPDSYLGEDPYKSTKLELTPAQKEMFLKQPHFDFASSGNKKGFEIDQVAQAQLDQMAELMKSRPKLRLEIGGFGCDRGSEEATRQISLGRAESVRRYLVSKGIPEDLLEIQGYGMQNPQSSNASEEGKMANRRVQFKFIP